ncbi:MAG: hypothetical protein LIO92_00620, partial [Clostridiales bacterium]|nr:hypothetical protein [Clostridiales bacterium]
DDDDPAEYNYYYMQSNGKAYKQTGDSISKKTINGKKYAFDEDGKMLYGWVAHDGSMLNGEDDWYVASTSGDSSSYVYYFGDWTDGSMKTGWQKITVHDPDKDDDYDYWFQFKSNGSRRFHTSDTATWKSGGKYYHFNEYGVMVYEWFITTDDASAADGYGDSSAWRYFNSPEDGARATKGWFKVVPPTDDNTFYEDDDTFAKSDSDDESERWYYADSDGILAMGEIKKIKGKYYGFFPDSSGKGGRMLVGLCALETDPSDGSVILSVIDDDMDSDDLDDFMDAYEGKSTNGTGPNDGDVSLYYFGDAGDIDVDGAIKTGSVSINLDGDSYSFYFKKTGGIESRGRGINGIDTDGYMYKFGQKMKADSDEKYIVVYATAEEGFDDAVVVDYDSSDVRTGKVDQATLLSDKVWDDSNDEYISVVYGFMEDMFLVNTSGKIQTGKKTGTKDGDDWYWYTVKGSSSEKGGNIIAYASTKNLKKSSEFLTLLGVENWDDITVEVASAAAGNTTADTSTDADEE